MSSYRRFYEGQIFFFTTVTHQRRPILTTALGRQALRQAIEEVRKERAFDITAIVLLPDHIHTLWQLPNTDRDYSTRWRRIKSLFTKYWQAGGGPMGAVNASRIKREEQGVWQRRFFEHTCRDEDDLKRCLDYVHFNPVKHGLVDRVADWPWSSFHRYVQLNEYDACWGGSSAVYGDEFIGAE